MRRAIFFAVWVISGLSSSICFAYSGGNGTAANPYQIATKVDLLTLGATTGHYNRYFILTADIDLTGNTFTKAVIASDINVDSFFDGTKFTGSFDGNGHIISNLKIVTTTGCYIGLFGYVGSGGQISNLGLVNVNVSGKSYVSGLCGCNNHGTISQCYTTGIVTGSYSSAGGLCGHNDSYGTLSQCYATGSVSAKYDSGGLCGINSGTISQCYATGTVTGSFSFAGGLCGGNSGSISQSYATGEVNGNDAVGGLSGSNSGNISQSYVTGEVNGSDAVGGLCGDNSGSISLSYATGTVTGSGENYAGGLCGYNRSAGSIQLCYAAGAVTGVSYVGGLCGGNDSTISNCFWDKETSGKTTSAGGTGKTTVQMQTVSTFTDAGWDFSNGDGDAADWILSGVQYPHLICVLTSVIPDVTGLMQQDASAALVAENFQIKTIYITSGIIPAGQVISQSPAAGPEIPCGSTITLTISWGGKYSGSGTAADPYQITTKYELLMFAATTADYSKYFILTADVDLAGELFTAAVIAPDTNNTTTNFQGTAFTGTFDGNGHTIRNLTITATKNDCVGLFGYVGFGGQVKNIGVVDSVIEGRRDVGGLCGYKDRGTLAQCYATGRVSGVSAHVGGLCGYNKGGVLNRCYATGMVTGSDDCVGGLCGYNYYATLNRCYATGMVTGSDDNVGGLCGYNDYGTLNQCYATGKVTGNGGVGGLCGENAGAISQCYATGTVAGTDYGVGGLCGRSGDLISQCYAAGMVTGESYVGGLCGYQYSSSARIQNSFWDTDASGLSVGYNLDVTDIGLIINVAGKTTAELQSASTFTDVEWDFSNTDGDAAEWILSGAQYPQLICEIDAVVPDIVGMTQQDAKTVLAAENLQISTVYIVSDAIPTGQVLSQSLAAGANVSCGSPIILTVSGGAKYAGSGTEEDPYQIATKYELLIFAARYEDYNRCFILTADIDLAGETFTTAVIAPVPTVNDSFSYTPFIGKFNANGHVISNLKIHRPVGNVLGLFGVVDFPGRISNLGLKDVDITGYNNVGGLCGENTGTINQCYVSGSVAGNGEQTGGLCSWSNGTISQCYVAGEVTGGSCIGGLCGRNDYYGTLSHCYVTGEVSGTSYVGGLCGYSNFSGNISRCYATGSVTGNSGFVGGLCGYDFGSTISQCYTLETVTASDAYYAYIGGLCGSNDSGTISQCYASGVVTGSNSNYNYVGGLCGLNIGTISQCYASGAVTGTNSNYNYVGGLCGMNSGTINRCYVLGTVTGNSSYVGGLCGYQYRSSAIIQNSFWNTDLSALTVGYNLDSSDSGTITNVVGKTTTEMKTHSTFTDAGWDFTNETANGTADFWRMCTDGINYPRLTWQYSMLGDFVCPDGVNTEDLSALSACWMETVEAKADIDADGSVNLNDYIKIAQLWMFTNCGTCGGADITGDGNVDQADLDLLAGQWLLEENTACQMADLDSNGKVDLADFAVFAGHWLQL